jgi:hypothetical protein
MSPIGRVFIVLNLLLAGTFVGFAGSYLQKQHNYKAKSESLQATLDETTTRLNKSIDDLAKERSTFENAKTAAETAKGALETENRKLADDNKLLSQRLATMEGNVAQINASLATANTQIQSAFGQAESAYKMAMADQKSKDDAVRARDAAEAENRTLKTTIASLESTIKGNGEAIADLQKERNELQLLVSVATNNGFVPALAAPPLQGVVAGVQADGRLCTISITDNESAVDIAEQIRKRTFNFAIYDASGYKAEAVVQGFDASVNAVTCRVLPGVGKPATIKVGDRATTKTP